MLFAWFSIENSVLHSGTNNPFTHLHWQCGVIIILLTFTLLRSSFVSGDFVNIFEHILQAGITVHSHG